ncbi:MAG: hypothetical protein RIT45_483 [Pseudomonadota bacterium]
MERLGHEVDHGISVIAREFNPGHESARTDDNSTMIAREFIPGHESARTDDDPTMIAREFIPGQNLRQTTRLQRARNLRHRHVFGLGLVAALLLCAATAFAWEFERGEWHGRIGGHLLSTTMAGITPASGDLPRTDLGLSVARLRPVLELGHGDTLRFEAAWDVLPVIGSGVIVQQLAVAPPNRLRWRDFDQTGYDGAGFDLQHNLDRLMLRWTVAGADIRIGRQAIGFGGARLLPTADLFGPFGPGSIATEFKRGVDALRITRPFGDRWELEAFAVLHRRPIGDEAADTGLRDGLYLLRALVRVPELLDASVLAGVSYRLPTLGWALNGDVLGAGWYVEGSARWDADAAGELGSPDGKLQLRATAGLDRQWENKLRTLVEVSYQSTGSNGDGSDNAGADAFGIGGVAAGLLGASSRLPVRVGEAFLMGQLHAAAVISREFWDLHNAQVAAIWNLRDGSGLLMPGVGLSLSDDVSLGVGALISVGKRPTRALLGQPVPRSELGSGPMVGYLDLRWGW